MVKILVTGGVGSVGRVAVARLLLHGHEVRVLDRQPAAEIGDDVWEDIKGADYCQADTTDFDALSRHFVGIEAVVHLAAYAYPGAAAEEEIFRVNCGGAFNVYRAAADAGIKRVVSASSINALGYNFGIKSFPIEYFPIDEAHPSITTDPYSFSKQVLEATAAYFWRREEISGICLRFPFVLRTSSHWAERMKGFSAYRRQAFETLAALPESERRARIDAAITAFDLGRADRHMERPWSEHHRPERREPPPPEQMMMFGRTDFWSIINAEDAAQAIEKGVLADYEGSHPLFVNDSENSLGVCSRLLAELYFPEVTTWKRDVKDAETLVSNDRARALIGYEPEHSMRAWAESESLV